MVGEVVWHLKTTNKRPAHGTFVEVDVIAHVYLIEIQVCAIHDHHSHRKVSSLRTPSQVVQLLGFEKQQG